jgi:hypothetical protein
VCGRKRQHESRREKSVMSLQKGVNFVIDMVVATPPLNPSTPPRCQHTISKHVDHPYDFGNNSLLLLVTMHI